MLDTPTPSGVRLDLIWLELTGRCNLECVHCYADAGPGRPLDEGMQLRDWQRALSDAALLGCRRVQFIGGEPTLHPGLPTLIEQAHQLGFEQICVFTNGMHLSETHKELFRRYQVQLAVSVYGSRAEVHDSITQHRGSFAKTERTLRWAVKAGIPVHGAIIGLPQNDHDLAENEQRLSATGLVSVGVDRIRRVGRGADASPPQSPMGELCGRCGLDRLCISATGEIFPCVFARFVSLGHATKDSLASALLGSRRAAFRQALATPARDLCQPDVPPIPCQPDVPPIPCQPEVPPIPCQPDVPPVPSVHLG